MALSKYDIQIDLENRVGTSHALMVGMVGSNKRVLDVGCDTGYLGEALNGLGNVTSGFEIDEVTAEMARTRLERVEVGDLESTDLVELFGPGSFDVVVYGDVLEHLRDPVRALRQARPLLASGGSVVISTPNIAHGDIRLALLHGRFRYTKVGILDETHTHLFTKDTLVEMLHDAGFVLADLQRTRAPLFGTEVGVHEVDFDPALVQTLRQDPEATTYQFVVRAILDDAGTAVTAVALRADELTAALDAERRQVATLTTERDQLVERIAEVRAELAAIEERNERDRQRSAEVGVPAPTRLQLLKARPELSGVRKIVHRVRRRSLRAG